MKKIQTIALTLSLAVFATFAFAQIKVVAPNGDVGIGTDSPIKKLHVTQGAGTGLPSISGSTVALFHKSSDAGNNAFMSFVGADAGAVGFYMGDSADENAGALTYRNSSDQFEMRTGGAGVDVYLDSDGDMGIGTIPTPAAKLHVNGAIHNAGGVVTSDKRLKKNVVSYNDGLQTIMQIEPVSFNYNGKAGITTRDQQVGIIAQDVQKVAPYLVTEWDYTNQDENGEIVESGTYLGVQNTGFTFMLINAVQQQQQMIADLQAEVEDLQNSLGENGQSINLEGEGAAFLGQNVPNPHNGQTVIDYELPENTTSANMHIFNIDGKLIQTVALDVAKKGKVNVTADNLPSGSYTYSLEVDNRIVASKVMVKSN